MPLYKDLFVIFVFVEEKTSGYQVVKVLIDWKPSTRTSYSSAPSADWAGRYTVFPFSMISAQGMRFAIVSRRFYERTGPEVGKFSFKARKMYTADHASRSCYDFHLR